ncbi:hypothetical protein JCM17845_14850 [Iodidimonas gelatinilytica]|uniref:Uncharacterized protein n=1 Tax=Iodidimonas gelatinilytica TaxID=1236966 RepID=A0A5A7MXZ8_9PROT|nr:hypothetical protein JCM17845_14850 [Iodidimonas gelatinilytica]
MPHKAAKIRIRPQSRQGFRIIIRIAADMTGRIEIGDQKIHRRTVFGLGLNGNRAVEFQDRAQKPRQCHHLPHQSGDRLRIIMGDDNFIHRCAQPDGAAAHIHAFDLEGLDLIVRRAAIRHDNGPVV